MIRVYVACDHAGVEFKNFCCDVFRGLDYEVVDLGVFDDTRVDYPDLAKKLCKEVLANPASQGCLICGTGIGMSMTANRFVGIRAALCHDAYGASITRAHNDANVLCMGARTTGLETARSIIQAWTDSSFEGGRHESRVKKIEQES